MEHCIKRHILIFLNEYEVKMCVHVDKTWKATKKNVSYVGGLFVFTYFICFLYLETSVNLHI